MYSVYVCKTAVRGQWQWCYGSNMSIIIIIYVLRCELWEKSTKVTESKFYDSLVRDLVNVHVGLNVSRSAHNIGYMVNYSNAIAVI